MRTLEHLRRSASDAIARETLESTRPSRTASAWAKSAANSKTSPSATSIPSATSRWTRRSKRAARRRSNFCAASKTCCIEQLRENNIEARVEWRIKRLYSIHRSCSAAITVRPGLRSARHPRHHHHVADCYAVFGLIHTHLASGARPHQGLHRHAARQSVSVAAHHGDGRRRPPVRSADPHRGNAPHRGRRHRGALEVQGQRRRVSAATSSARLGPPARRVAARDDRSQRVPLHPQDRSVPGRGLHLHPQGQGRRAAQGAHARSTSPTPIHTEVGNTCVGAKVNGRMVPLRTHLRNGDIVEVLTQNGHTPSRDWLTFVKSSAPATRSSTGSMNISANAPSRSAESCSNAKPASTRSRSPASTIGLRPRCRRIRRGDANDLLAAHRLRQILRPPGAQQLAPGIATPADGAKPQTQKTRHRRAACPKRSSVHLIRLRLSRGRRAERSAGLSRAML